MNCKMLREAKQIELLNKSCHALEIMYPPQDTDDMMHTLHFHGLHNNKLYNN